MSHSKPCSVEGCESPSLSRGYCNRHYLKWRKYGNPTEDRTGNLGKYERPERRCSLPDCDSRHYGKGYCELHWNRWRDHGDPLHEPFSKRREYKRIPPFERMEGKYEIGPECWEWTGYKTKDGYGLLGAGGRGAGNLYAHRLAWERWRGVIPDGYEVDHLCFNTSCINPDHLEAVTPQENKSRARLGRDSAGRFISAVH